MPRGSDYPGPADALERYVAAVEAADAEVKGAKNPYTSTNGHMYSFLDPEGVAAVRLSDELAAEFAESYETGPVTQYGRTMHGYVSVPSALLADTEALSAWIARSLEWIATLPPK